MFGLKKKKNLYVWGTKPPREEEPMEAFEVRSLGSFL